MWGPDMSWLHNPIPVNVTQSTWFGPAARFALPKLTRADETKIRALVKKAVS